MLPFVEISVTMPALLHWLITSQFENILFFLASINRMLWKSEFFALPFPMPPLSNLLCLVDLNFDHWNKRLVVWTRHQFQLLKFIYSWHWKWLMSVIKLLNHVSDHCNVLFRLWLPGKSQETFQPPSLIFNTITTLSMAHHLLIFLLILLTYSIHFLKI